MPVARSWCAATGTIAKSWSCIVPATRTGACPRGKMLSDEYLAVTAVREVREETGHHIRLLRPLSTARYPINSHVEDRRSGGWPSSGQRRCARPRQRDRPRRMVAGRQSRSANSATPTTVKTTVEALRRPEPSRCSSSRHTKAMSRKKWPGRRCRPHTDRTRQAAGESTGQPAGGVRCGQARQLGFDPVHGRRCRRTRAKIGAEIKGYPALSRRGRPSGIPNAVTKAMAELAKRSRDAATPPAVCGHRPVLPAMFNYFNVVPDHVLGRAR